MLLFHIWTFIQICECTLATVEETKQSAVESGGKTKPPKQLLWIITKLLNPFRAWINKFSLAISICVVALPGTNTSTVMVLDKKTRVKFPVFVFNGMFTKKKKKRENSIMISLTPCRLIGGWSLWALKALQLSVSCNIQIRLEKCHWWHTFHLSLSWTQNFTHFSADKLVSRFSFLWELLI